MLLTVHIPAGVQPRQIDIPEGVARSRKGALHITPISTIELTKGELNYLEKAEPELHRALIVFGQSPSLADKVKNDPKVAKKMAESERTKVKLARKAEAESERAKAQPAANEVAPAEPEVKAEAADAAPASRTRRRDG